MTSLLDKMARRREELARGGLLRQRRCFAAAPGRERLLHPVAHATDSGKPLLDFAANDYLGLARHPKVISALAKGAEIYGCGSGASPLVSGYSEAHLKLEQGLCRALGAEAALLFSCGFAANTALMKTLFSAEDTVIADKLVHASMIDGLRDSKAKIRRFAHNDMAAATTLLARHPGSAVLTETVFSMDGDRAPLGKLSHLCQEHGSPLILDDAHGFGLFESSSLPVFARLVTFGKALGGQGAAIVGSQELIDYLVANAREYIYSTALSPACCMGVLKALELIQQEPLLERLNANIALFRRSCQEAGISLMPSESPIQPLLVGESDRCMALAARLLERGFLVGAIRPPTVPKGSARLRITLSAEHREQDILALASALAELMA
ncbi:aminotransferase class I/II-fold pyridoxal phosphate-dependent enzyme [Shewanella algae]|uniref:aminotransferase class I/II-fold pyridoxal phosphate-dependent enzyme n=1 Tax=Shewanella algae TaxID=38313 RepID=UPI0004688BD5|nr:8-amino-7-oxononanoate synthase [Shewanella algae]MBO2570059.1 8-amino-7-oxononanoate synthase [Shewanella algae]NKZ44017.1 8-amino-7-oxononanoate synthase [Shewanella algae]QTE76624.1 8-amino-7-oxononanoate synthase [Shewanella algae]